MSNFMGVGIFCIGLNRADLGCWRLTLRWYKSSLKVCFLGWIASHYIIIIVVSRHKYMCVLNDQCTINGQRNNINYL